MPYAVPLDSKPCVIEYVDAWSSFLIGTYNHIADGVESKYSKERIATMNGRSGSLVIMKHDDVHEKFKISHSIDCQDGGVFDFVICQQLIYVAHANDAIGLYEYQMNNGFTLRQSFKLDEANNCGILLTTIDTFLVHPKPAGSPPTTYILAGDSGGRVSIACGQTHEGIDQVLMQYQNIGDSRWIDCGQVWTAKFVPIKDPSDFGDALFFIMATEAANWCLCRFDLTTNKFTILSKNLSEFKAGVISICFLAHDEKNSAGSEDGDESGKNNSRINVVLGSYDETIRSYEVKLPVIAGSFAEITPREEVKIENGGNWHIRLIKDRLYISSMYAGAFTADPNDIAGTLTSLAGPDLISRTIGDAREERSLTYGVGVSLRHNVACLVDYNQSHCVFIEV